MKKKLRRKQKKRNRNKKNITRLTGPARTICHHGLRKPMYRTQAITVLGVSEVDLIRRQFLAYGTASEKENTIGS
jgi:hypothetical protein